jgi:ATP-dependent protease HslVU (ClpYQ) peptidase subunit
MIHKLIEYHELCHDVVSASIDVYGGDEVQKKAIESIMVLAGHALVASFVLGRQEEMVEILRKLEEMIEEYESHVERLAQELP